MRVILVVVVLAFAVLSWMALAGGSPALRVENRSPEAIRSLQVGVGEEEVELAALPSCGHASVPLPLRREGPLRVHVQFASGAETTSEGGWFLPGMRGGPALTIVAPDSVRLAGP